MHLFGSILNFISESLYRLLKVNRNLEEIRYLDSFF